MKDRLLSMVLCVVLVASTGFLSACGSPRVVVVTSVPSLTPAVVTVIVTPTPTFTPQLPTPTFTPSPTTMPEAERIPVMSPISLSSQDSGGYRTYSIDIPFRDADGDATEVHYDVVSSTTDDIYIDDGTVEAGPTVQQEGTSVTGTWDCGEEAYTVVLAIQIRDAAGHASTPQQVTIDCPGVEPTVTPTPEPTWTPLPTLPPPGPAKVTGSLPKTIPCEPYDVDGCLWDYTITFTNDGSATATITQIGRRYIDANGGVWTSQSGEWHDETIIILGYMTNNYSSWVRTAGVGDKDNPDLRGGTLKVSWKGTDSQGKAFSGSTTAHLAAQP